MRHLTDGRAVSGTTEPGLVIITPGDRGILVPYEDRSPGVAAENRGVIVGLEDRAPGIAWESRVAIVPASSPTVTP
jgi:hypothetical protein